MQLYHLYLYISIVNFPVSTTVLSAPRARAYCIFRRVFDLILKHPNLYSVMKVSRAMTILLIYLLILLTVFLLQRKMMYFPTPFYPETAGRTNRDFKLATLAVCKRIAWHDK